MTGTDTPWCPWTPRQSSTKIPILEPLGHHMALMLGSLAHQKITTSAIYTLCPKQEDTMSWALPTSFHDTALLHPTQMTPISMINRNIRQVMNHLTPWSNFNVLRTLTQHLHAFVSVDILLGQTTKR